MASIRNNNPQPVYIPNQGGESEPRQSPISSFGADMDTGRSTRYNADGTEETQYAMSPQQQVFEQYGQMVKKAKAAEKQQRDMTLASGASMLLHAKDNNGFVHPSMLPSLSQQFGFDIAGGNYTSDGNFVIYGREELRDRNGRQMTTGRMVPKAVLSPEQQFQILNQSGLGEDMQIAIYDRLSGPGGKRKDQLAARGIVDPRETAKANAASDALKATELGMKQQNQLIGSAQKQVDMLYRRRDAIAAQNPKDPQLQALDRQIDYYNRAIGAAFAGGAEQWELALNGTVGAASAASSPRSWEGESNVGADETVKVGGQQVPRYQIDQSTGEMVVNTHREQRDGGHSFRLQQGGLPHYGEKWVYEWREGQSEPTRRRRKDDEQQVSQLTADEDGVDGVMLNGGNGKGVIIPAGKVIGVGKGRYKVEGEPGNYALVPTDEEPNWFSSRKRPSKSTLDKSAQYVKDDKTGEIRLQWKDADGSTRVIGPGDTVTDADGNEFVWNGYRPDAPDKGFSGVEESDAERASKSREDFRRKADIERRKKAKADIARDAQVMRPGPGSVWGGVIR